MVIAGFWEIGGKKEREREKGREVNVIKYQQWMNLEERYKVFLVLFLHLFYRFEIFKTKSEEKGMLLIHTLEPGPPNMTLVSPIIYAQRLTILFHLSTYLHFLLHWGYFNFLQKGVLIFKELINGKSYFLCFAQLLFLSCKLPIRYHLLPSVLCYLPALPHNFGTIKYNAQQMIWIILLYLRKLIICPLKNITNPRGS